MFLDAGRLEATNLTLVKGDKSPQWKFVPGGTHKPFFELTAVTPVKRGRRKRVNNAKH